MPQEIPKTYIQYAKQINSNSSFDFDDTFEAVHNII